MRRPDLKKLKEYLEYQPDTGLLIRKYQRGIADRAGQIAGTVNRKNNLTFVTFDYQVIRADRLIWFMQTGYWHTQHEIIHHKDFDPSNTKWENLELKTKEEVKKMRIQHRIEKYGNKPKYKKKPYVEPKKGRPKRKKGIKKLDKFELARCRKLWETGLTYKELAAVFNVSHITIGNYIREFKEKGKI
jgi:hypothetical protein